MVALAKAVSDNWEAIIRHCNKSVLSQTVPRLDAERSITGTHDLNEIPAIRAKIRIGAKYILKADVANFYGSIYTHAIPWAFHSKPIAKRDRSVSKSRTGGQALFGNLLDQASRDIQSGQTIGVPIGPDTSFAIAESVLCAVDSHFTRKIGAPITGFRFIDDYEFACDRLSKAESIRAILQDALMEFELQLNSRKTRIIELPDVLDTAWVHELASFELVSAKSAGTESRLLRYFSRAFELVRENPGEPVLKYAVCRLAEEDLLQLHILLQQLVLHAATVDPGTLHTALYIVYLHQNNLGLTGVDHGSLTRALSAIIEQHAPLQHGGDVAWALWGAIVFKVTLQDRVVQALERLTDPIAILMALHAEQDGRLARAMDKTPWIGLTNLQELFDSSWLLVYEGVGKGWIKAAAGDPAVSDPFFADARSKNISFYNQDEPRRIPAPSRAGEYD
jgi:hypothetical protein